MGVKSIPLTVPPKEWGLHRVGVPQAGGLRVYPRILLTSVGLPVSVTPT